MNSHEGRDSSGALEAHSMWGKERANNFRVHWMMKETEKDKSKERGVHLSERFKKNTRENQVNCRRRGGKVKIKMRVKRICQPKWESRRGL